MTRRRFLIAAGVVAAAAVTAGSVAVVSQQQSTPTIDTLAVPSGNVATLSDYSQIDASSAFALQGDYSLPFGTQLWCNDDSMAACLIPTDQASPLSLGAVLDLSTGKYTTVLGQANGQGDGFEIYDIRGTAQGLVWTECNIFENTWRVLCAGLSGTSLSNARIVDSGDGSTESPSLAAVGPYAYWTVMPPASADNASSATAQLKRATMSGGDAEVVYESTGRMACPLYADNDAVVLAPHHPSSTRYYQLVRIDTQGNITDTLTLPSGMQPNEVGYGPNGFSFCFESIYNFGDGIANLGTYSPTAAGSGYNNANWFRFGRTPLAAPASCGNDWFVVKSTQSVCALNFANQQYCTFDLLSGCTNWGDYLSMSGTRNRIVTVAQVDASTAETTSQSCHVRVWRTV